MKLKSLEEVESHEKFWSGTRLRNYKVGLNVKVDEDDYYDYILAYALWEKESMMLVNVTNGLGKNKAGSVYGGVLPVRLDTGSAVVDRASFEFTLGELKDWFIILD
ncbi:MAG: hypothetical protein KAH25_07965 [Bacteroidales bacterium]|nr:hypothetical protein [Bacteroidales bacterium]